MSENVKHTVLRFAIVFGVILLFFIVVFVRIISLQTVHRSELEAMVADRDSVYKTIKAVRGNIFDCEGRLLASSVPQYSIHMDTRVEALHMNKGKLFYEYVDSIAYGLSRIVGDQTPEEYRNKIVKAYRGKTRSERDIRLTTKRISYTQLKEIKQLPLIRRGVYKSGFYAVDLNLRVKPFNSLGSRTIGGIYAESGKGNAGLEKRFDDYLQGEDGLAIRERMANQWQYIPIREEKHGCDVYTTLDANLMDICESNLRARLEHTQADWGCVILMEVATGEIKAMCNLDRGSDLQYYEIANHAVIRMEPGSTFKTIAMMAALDDGKFNIDDTLRVWKDGWNYHGATHRDAHPADTVYTMRQALAVSSNIALARMITDGYNGSAKKFVNKLKRMGLCDSIDYIIPGAHQPRINIPKDTVTISRMAYGYSVELSPLQVLTFYNGIANDGRMISPVLVTEVKDGKTTIESFETQTIKSNLCSKQTLEDIRASLLDVVWDNDLGTAAMNKWRQRKAQSDLVKIAGKTGTAQVMENGKYFNNKHRMSFVGYFPADAPRYSCICVIHAPRNKGAYDSGLDCGSVVRKIAEKTMVYTSEYRIEDKQLVMMAKED
jgi:cell division protein FtsI (penicillin-binding protein 3)